MKKTITMAAVGLIWAGVALADASNPSLTPARLSIYKVPLVCPAAHNIGCGSRAKPILQAFEHEQTVAGAWLNRPGTLLAIEWKPDATRKARRATLKSVTQQEELEAKELGGKERASALADFLSGNGWLRANQVDRLSEEEARILAGRLTRKIRTLITVSDEQAKSFDEQFSAIIKQHLVGESRDETTPRDEILKLLRQQLSENDVIRLQEGLKDYHPNREEPE